MSHNILRALTDHKLGLMRDVRCQVSQSWAPGSLGPSTSCGGDGGSGGVEEQGITMGATYVQHMRWAMDLKSVQLR